MQVFKLFFKVLKSYKGVILVYGIVSFAVAFLMTGPNSGGAAKKDADEMLRQTPVNIAVIDRDTGNMGEIVKEFVKRKNKIVDIEENDDAIAYELYWRAVDYVLIIPEGFEDELLAGKEPAFEGMSTPGTYKAAYFTSELTMYISKIKGLVDAGYTLDEAVKLLDEIGKEECTVSLASFVNENQHDAATVFLSFVPYMFITLCMGGMGMALMRFNEKEVSARMECSPTPLYERTAGFICGTLFYGAILFVVVMIAACAVSGGSLLSDTRLPYFIVNILAMLLLGLSLGFFAGIVSKGNNMLTGLLNIISLALCFFGGVFVPREFFGESVMKVAKLFPTYWYIENNEMIGAVKTVTPAFKRSLFSHAGIVSAYAVGIFAITVVIIYRKRQMK